MKAMSIACLALLLGVLPAVAAEREPSLDDLLDGAEKAMQDSGDNLRQRDSGRSLNNQSDAIAKLEEYKKGADKKLSSRDRTRILTDRDLDNLVKQIEKAMREGNREEAQRLLEQLAQIMENLQLAQPGQDGDSELEQAFNELNDMIRKQQQLRDKTFKQGQDSRRDRMRGKQQGEQGMGDLQQDQQGLRDRLKKLQQELAKRGMGPGQKGDQDQPGAGDEGDDGEDGLGQADNAMGDAGSKLGAGNADGAVDSQGKALEALRKGAQKLAEAMQQGDGDGQGPGERAGRQQAGPNGTDPLGRPLRSHEYDELSKMIPGEMDVQKVRRILEELRRRLADPSRSQVELDYIERLLKDY